ncbi:MAG: dihydroxy-acid dehydratase, partial [Chloroflexi bacterium]|nr:dihydroxy-acid dehydratase [Chloroflexota bacterium]
VYGNLAPHGAILKHSAATRSLLQHRARAHVFHSYDALLEAADTDEDQINPEDALVLGGAGPLGGPGMPEVGNLPIPRALLRQGIRDMLRISDARMSGTAFGTVVLHVCPEAASGGPLGLVYTGDEVELDWEHRALTVLIDDRELKRRAIEGRWPAVPERGYARLFAEHVLQADEGCDFDFLRPSL